MRPASPRLSATSSRSARSLTLGHLWHRLVPMTVYEDPGARGYQAAFTVDD
jgi:hypothetical protein